MLALLGFRLGGGFAQAGPPCHLLLHLLEGGPVDDGRVGVFHVVFGELALIFHLLAAEQIQGEGFLEDGVAHVLLVLQDVAHRVVAPISAAAGSLETVRRQILADLAHALAHQVPGEDTPDGGGFGFVDLRLSIRALAVAEKVIEVIMDDALLEPGLVPPADVGRHGLAFRLCLTHQEGEDHLIGHIEGVGIFFFKPELQTAISYGKAHKGQYCGILSEQKCISWRFVAPRFIGSNTK